MTVVTLQPAQSRVGISRAICASLVACAIFGWSAEALPQSYPAKPVRVIVPLAAGGPTDVLVRTISQNLGESWGQVMVIDNRPGANTNIGTIAVAKSPPDSYTLLMTVNNLTINPSFYQNAPFEPLKDFAPITLFATSPLILVAHPSVTARSVKELLALAKARPRELFFGSTGNGSPPHLAGEMFNTLAGVKLVLSNPPHLKFAAN